MDISMCLARGNAVLHGIYAIINESAEACVNTLGRPNQLRWFDMESVHEEWRSVVGYESWYSVSSLGRLRRDAPGPSTKSGKVLTPRYNNDGYQTYRLHKQDGGRGFFVHRLVFQAFVGAIPLGCEINHIDGDKQNNTPANLEAVTHAENVEHSVRTGLYQAPPCGSAAVGAKLTEASVFEILSLKGIVSERKIALVYGVSRATIRFIYQGKTWKHVVRVGIADA